MSESPVYRSFLDYLLTYPTKRQKQEIRQFRAVITYQFILVCIGIYLTASVLDFILNQNILAYSGIIGILIFMGILYLHYKAYYILTSSVAIIAINAIILLHDARYGIHAGIYFFYFPLFFAIFSTFSYRKKIWIIIHLILTASCWALMEITGHSFLYTNRYSYQTLHFIFLFCMVTSLCVTILFVYLILNQIRSNAIIREQEKLKSVLDSNIQMMMLINKDRQIELFNRKFFDYYQTVYGDTLQVGTNYLNYGNPQNRVMEAEELDRAFAGQTIQKDMLVMMGNAPTWMSLTFVPVIDKKGEIHNVAFSVLDISERKNYEKNLSETNAILTKLNHELDHFIYRSSHDMRAPLASVLGLVELFQTEDDESEREEYITMIGKSVNKLDKLLVDITQYAKNKKLELRYQPIYFSEIINELIEGLKFAKNAQTIDFKVKTIQSGPFYCDEERLRSVIGNLLSNAVRYRSSQDFPFVTVNVVVSDTSAHITIADNGIGIEAEYQSRIFDMFFKVSHQSVGSGLGLYIVKETVTALGGTISLQSTVGIGTVFTIEIPCYNPSLL